MKEIDFIPSWYHENRRRRGWYFRRYVTILVLTAVWMLGNLIAGGIISNAYGDLDSLRSSYEKGLQKIDQARKLEARLGELTRQKQMLQHLCPRTEVSPILAELSSRIGERVVLTDLSLIQTSLEDLDSPKQTGSAAVKVKSGQARSDKSAFESDTVLKVVLAGMAADGGEVAALISRLEESEYFARVVPVFSRNQSRFDTTVTEFEIRCVVADYVIVE